MDSDLQSLTDINNGIKSLANELSSKIKEKAKFAETMNLKYGLCVECLIDGLADVKAEQNLIGEYYRLCKMHDNMQIYE